MQSVIRRLLFRQMFHTNCPTVFAINKQKWSDCLQKGLSTFLFAAAAVSFASQSSAENKIEQNKQNEPRRVIIEPPDPNTLTEAYLIKSSAISTVDSISTLLSQTVQAIINAENEYIKTVENLIALKELQLQTLGDQDAEDKVWDAIMEIRADINKHKQNKENLEMLLSYVEKMLSAAAEVAYLSGAEYSSISANEKLYSVKTYLQQTRQSSSDIHIKLAAMEAKVIEAISRKDKEHTNQE